MRINNKLLSDFRADLRTDFSVKPKIRQNLHKPRTGSRFRRLTREIGLKEVILNIDFLCESYEEVSLSYSKLLAELLADDLTIQLPDGFRYACAVDSVSEITYPAHFMGSVSVVLTGVQLGPRVSTTVANNVVFCNSTHPETDCVLSVTVGASAASYVLQGITFTNARAGERLTIDGEKTRVLVNGAPALLRCDIVKFPTLKPGPNQITAPDPVTVEFWPTYL